MPDPGPVSLATCRHVDAGPSGKDVKARPVSDLWVKPGPNGCLRYAEDGRGNRVPDFSHAGYRSGGVPLPRVNAPAGVLPLLPGDAGDDTAAIQAAIDAVAALAAGRAGHARRGRAGARHLHHRRRAEADPERRGAARAWQRSRRSGTVLRGVGHAPGR